MNDPALTSPLESQEVIELRKRVAVQETALHEMQAALDTYRLVLDQSSDPIFMFASDGTYRFANPAFANGVGRPLESIVGHRIWDVFPTEEADKRYSVVKWVYENGQTRVIEVCVARPDGDHFYITTAKPILDEAGTVSAVVCISKEITERKRMEEELRLLSIMDLLTGVYNRNFFETEVERIQNSRLFPVSIVMVDLNNLKIVNDTDGHAAGDELIRCAAQVLKQTFRAEDIIARFGGDEFVVLLPETDETTAAGAITRVRAAIQGVNDPRLSLAFGWATGQKGDSLQDVMRRADDAMYQDKRRTARKSKKTL